MSWSDEFYALLNKQKKEKKSMDFYKQAMRSGTQQYHAQKKEAEKEKESGWFKSGAFSDGYQFGDVTRTILGTSEDLRENLVAGVLGMGEQAVDAGAYLVGGVGGLFGADKFQEDTKKFISRDLYDEKKIAEKIVGTALAPWADTKDSVFGDKADSLAQSGGQLLGTAALQLAGVPWFVTMGVTSFGSEAESAFNQGATYGEAGLSAAITAGAEMLTEKLSGGIKFGGKTLDDVLLDPFIRGISNKTVRFLTNMGVDMAGEGFEEILSGYLGAIGQKLSYMDDKELGELFTSEDAVDSFLGGMILGGGGNVVQGIQAKAHGVDAVTGLSDNEQKVFDQVYKEELSKAEENGKLSKTEKAELYDKLMEDMEKGYISTDTIEKALGDRTAMDALQKESDEFDKLYNTASNQLSKAQSDRLAELEAKQKATPYADAVKNAKGEMSQKVYEQVKGTRLEESYREKARRGQAFQADLSRYDEKQQALVKKAMDSGVLNNTRRTHEFVDMIAKIGAEKGISFDFTNNEKLKASGFAMDGKTVNGFVSGGNVTLNIHSAKALNSVVGHEITHVLEGTELYDSLKKTLFDYAKTKGEYQGRYDALAKLYENVKDANIEGELVADLVGDYIFSDADFVKNLSTGNRNVFQKIFDEIKYLCKVATKGSKEARELEKVKKIFEEAYRAQKNTADDGGVKYSIKTTEDGIRYVRLDGNIFLREDGTEMTPVEAYNSIVGKKLTLEDGDVITFIKKLPETNVYKELFRKLPGYEDGIDVKAVSEAINKNILEVVSASSIDERNQPQKHNHIGIVDFDQRAVYLADDSDAYRLELCIANLTDGTKIAYVKRYIEKASEEIAQKIKKTETAGQTRLKRPSDYTVSQEGENVKHSLSDSDGKQLTKEQQEYFKDSKIRDADGNLKVMHHGSGEAFTIFDKKKARASGYYGNGFYFTDSESHAKQYGNTYDVYLNITNPLKDGTKNITKEQLRKFVEAIAENEDYGIENYGYGATVDSVVDSVYGKSDFAMLMDINASCVGNMVEAVEFFNEVNGTDYNGIVADTETVAFYPEQIKRTDNLNPTENEDIRYSLSDIGEQAKRGRGTYGEDIMIAPVKTEVNTANTEVNTEVKNATIPVATQEETQETVMFPDDLPSIDSELDELNSQKAQLEDRLIELSEAEDFGEEFYRLSEQWSEVDRRIKELEQEASQADAERLESLQDAPPEREQVYDEKADIVPLTKKAEDWIARNVKDVLGASNREMGAVRELIREYSENEFPNRDELAYKVWEKLGQVQETTEIDETVKDIQKDLRNYHIKVSEQNLADLNTSYGELRKRYFNKIRFSKEGSAADVIYHELQDAYPGFFPDNIFNPSDMLEQIMKVADMDYRTTGTTARDSQMIYDAVDAIMEGVDDYRAIQREKFSDKMSRQAFDALVKEDMAPVAPEMVAPVAEDVAPVAETPDKPVKTKADRINDRLKAQKAALAEEYMQQKAELKDRNAWISKKAGELYDEIRNLKKGVRASRELGYLLDSGNDWSSIRSALVNIKHTPDKRVNLHSSAENLAREMLNEEYENRLYNLEDEYRAKVKEATEEAKKKQAEAEKAAQTVKRSELHKGIVDNLRNRFAENGFDLDEVLGSAKNLSTFATVDNTPQRVMEKALGYKEGQVLADETVNKVAQNETEGIKWLNSHVDTIKAISKQYHIKPRSKESAAAQMYAEGFYVDDKNNIIQYGNAELAQDFPDAQVQKNIKALAGDPRIRKIYDETLEQINSSRARNAYPEIGKLDNYFLHFRAMNDTFSRLGLPFNPNDIRAKDLPTDLNGVTADLKPGQPFFASAMHRKGMRTSFDLLGGLEQYLTSAKNQIYHIDDIQTLRALRNYIADTYGQANGLEGLDALSEEEAQERIEKVYNAHLSTFAKFLNEEANVLAGKTALIDRGLEGIIGRRGMTFLDTVNKQVGSNMVGFNISSSLTNFLPVAQTFAKTNKVDFVKALGQTVSTKVGSIFGRTNSFAENSPVMIRRKGADRFARAPWQKVADAGYAFMSAVDDVSTELIARTKFNEFTRKGIDEKTAHMLTDKWVSRLMGDRSLGQQPQLYNSKMLGIFTKFQLEVRNQLDSQFYDTIQEAKVSNEDIQNGLARNAKTAAKVTSTFVQLAVAQHLFGKAFESVAGYNPAFDIISVILTACGYGDDEESEDTPLDNIEQAFLELLEDLPYTSTFTGGRIPISSAFPVKQLVTGKDEYGNDKPRLETLGEVAPYYLLPGGYGQIKKTYQGLKMFDEDLPVAGSYTDSGGLRFPVEDTLGNRVQAAIFGQYASKNAREYFDNDFAPLKEKQIEEFVDLGIPISDYRKIRSDLAKLDTLGEKAVYIANLDLSIDQKNLLINNIANREEPIDLTGMVEHGDYGEFEYAKKYPNKYQFLNDNGISYDDYQAFDEDTKEAWSWAYQNPEKFAVSKAVAGDPVAYKQYTKALSDLKADKDENGKSISGSRKEKVLEYINSLDADYGEKIVLYKLEYPSDDRYNRDILEYLKSRSDLSYEEKLTICKELGFTVRSDGYVTWD